MSMNVAAEQRPDSDVLMPGIICAVFTVLIVGCVFLVIWAVKRRRQQVSDYANWAAQSGYQYIQGDRSLADLSFRKPFRVGSARYGKDVFRGVYRGRHIVFGEYHYATPGAEGRTNHHLIQVVAVALPSPRPYLDITREDAGTKFKAMFGARDLQVNHAEFDDRFHVDTDHVGFAHDILTPGNIQWLLSDYRANMYQFRFEGQWLMTLRPGRLDLNEVHFYADFLHDLIGIVPERVWQG
ncbi:MAG TPA: hypothetical protein VE172_04150 [Stackebrandtia sp.]|uniref:hypothetical protein n=1 Tax=Stackebrandtia sp. TaxID=2023065 RepID=UPI002D45C440|nr:hypothetical protein [Stackebrandtia sp.]HZE37983.1 hypothetical protein [Stackebrandtia sp.]